MNRCVAGIVCALWACLAAAASALPPAQGFYRAPALHGNTLVFVAEGDLWRVTVEGGSATRLTRHVEQELRPAISPDGQWLAFNASYEGAFEAYVMPMAGGLPQRLTWDGRGSRVMGFAPDGAVLLLVDSVSGRPGWQLMKLDPRTLATQVLPAAGVTDGALSPDGRSLYFTRGGLQAQRGDNVAGYRGGNVAQIWTLDLASQGEARPFVTGEGHSRLPMPLADSSRVLFLSDRDGRFNLWSVDRRGGAARQHTRHRGQDVRHAALHGTRVVYSLGADLRLLDLASGQDRVLPITLQSDFVQRGPRRVPAPPFWSEATLAPDGQRVAITARGRIAVARTGRHRRVELPVPADAGCRRAVFSHDSSALFAVCDSSGEQEIWRFAADGSGDAQRLTQDGDGHRHGLFPSPDGRWIAHIDHRGRLRLTALKGDGTGETRLVEQARQPSWWHPVRWSPDGQLLVYTRGDPVSRRNRLMLYRVKDGRAEALTSDRYHSHGATFTPDGRWLYFLSDRHFEARPASPWGDRNLGPAFERRTRIFALAMQPGLRFPFKARDELSSPAPAAAATPSAPAASAAPAAVAALRPAARLDGLAARLHEVPLPAGGFEALFTDGRRLYFADRDPGAQGLTLRSIAIDETPGAPELLMADLVKAEASADGRRLLLVRRHIAPARPPALPPRAGDILLMDAAAKPPGDLGPAQLRWSDWLLYVDPPAEWRQIFADAWRMQRDFHHDPGLNGVDWVAERRRHEPLLARVTDRHELSELLAQMVTALGTLHSQVRTRDIPIDTEPQAAPAGLGALLAPQPGGVRVVEIFESDPELPTQFAPLRAAGVQAGEVITAVNGRSVAGLVSLHNALLGQAGRQVLLTLAAGGGADREAPARRVVVEPVSAVSEQQLRLTHWEWQTARSTLERSQGRVGYLRLRAMWGADMASFVREFYSHLDRDGVVLDLRSNSGGNIDSWVLATLMRRAWAFWQLGAPEGSVPYSNMQQAFRGRVVALIDENTYSDGETLAEGLRRLGLGTLVGRRTAGAGVWLSDTNLTLDLGMLRVAESGQFVPGEPWLIERVGVAPDIEVDNLPRATHDGKDAQLEAAIAHLLAQPPRAVPVPPPYARPFARP